MATPAEIQAELDAANTMFKAQIVRSGYVSATKDEHYVVGLAGYAGRSRWVVTTSSGSAATQAAAILAELIA